MTFRSIPTYRDESGNTVTFKPVADVPGWSHRVIVNHKPVDYLGNHQKPTAKVAAFFYQKHAEAGA